MFCFGLRIPSIKYKTQTFSHFEMAEKQDFACFFSNFFPLGQGYQNNYWYPVFIYVLIWLKECIFQRSFMISITRGGAVIVSDLGSKGPEV